MQTKIMSEKMFIAGKWQAGKETFDVVNPQNNEVIAKVPLASKDDMISAIEQADVAFQHLASWPVHERIRVLTSAANYLQEHHELFAETISLEGSKTITESRGEVSRAIQTIRISAEEARRLKGETINFDQKEGSENRVGYYYRFPIGVIGAITPFNDPLNLVAHKIGPAIAAGNPIVLKPASVTPLSAIMLAKAFDQAGIPKGFLSVITGAGREIGEVLVTHPAVKMVSFTGGLEAGKHIAHQAGLKKISMELGSNSPVIILNDACLTEAVASTVSGAFSAVGQNCIGVQRIYVEEAIYDTFLQKFIERTKELQVGDKMSEWTDMGPLIQEKEAIRVEEWVQEALMEGATLETGGTRDGAFYDPTVLTNVSHDSKVYYEEIFGPVVIIESIQNIQEAVKRANEVEYGLQAGIFTKNLDDAFYTVQKLHVGGVMVNDSSDYRIDEMPFGGVKGSGLGREGVKFSMEEMTEPKVVCFKLGNTWGM
ncbi:aldehyde dehydrogenase [Salipaludibacillus neizhouensis]|uniref:3-sulfolactaldehyde dehydrogenase n=1 Tax=Salipaludibacillus neizhouensis TaxID=885475 RepID=A0A3A9K7K2_9BACI|nr:aldehyde dehydrogenase family protein [Salipaludibacillus neizhouensis]RKL66820.1 aldehyde dehydrogenase [Salipaludibacillus neizhouensis]